MGDENRRLVAGRFDVDRVNATVLVVPDLMTSSRSPDSSTRPFQRYAERIGGSTLTRAASRSHDWAGTMRPAVSATGQAVSTILQAEVTGTW